MALIVCLARGQHAPAMVDTIEPRPADRRQPALAALSSGAARREQFAGALDSRFARKKQSVRVEAVGSEKTVFRFTWPADHVDLTHIDQLKTAAPFHRELRGMGFRALVLRAGERVVWSRSF